MSSSNAKLRPKTTAGPSSYLISDDEENEADYFIIDDGVDNDGIADENSSTSH